MAGRDITEGLPVNVGNPGIAGFWINNAEDFDVAIGGEPFILAPTDVNPYQRETAPYRKDQFDNSKEPGEQSLTGWWIRSQSSFHDVKQCPVYFYATHPSCWPLHIRAL